MSVGTHKGCGVARDEVGNSDVPRPLCARLSSPENTENKTDTGSAAQNGGAVLSPSCAADPVSNAAVASQGIQP